MKRWLCLLLALMLLLSGCSKDAGGKEPAAATERPAAESAPEAFPGQGANRDSGLVQDKFGLTYVAEFGFNPYTCTCITNRPVLSLVYEGLFVLNSYFEPEPVLCERFAASEDGKHYLFTICPDAVFSDGSPVTAADAAASLEAARDSAYFGSRFSKVIEFRAEDERKLAVTLSTPYENLPLLMDVPIVKADTVADATPIGSGPYAFAAGSRKRLLRSAGWWQNCPAPIAFDEILLTEAKDPTEIRDSFEFGDTSLVCADLNAPTAVGYRCDYELWDCPTSTMVYLGFNLERGMFVNRGFRAGITHIIDRNAITTKICKGFAETACLPCSPASPLYDETLAKSFGYDVAAFRSVRNEAGISSEYVGTFLVCSADPTMVEIAHRVAEMLNQAGVRVEVHAADYDTFHYLLRAGKFDCFLGEVRLSATFDLSEFFRRYGGLNYGGLQSESMETLCKAALENSGNCYDLFRSVMERGSFCPLLFKSYAVMAKRGAIDSLQPAVDNVFHLSGGRSLADAGTVYEILTGEATEETESPAETGEPENP